ncbi:MAG: DUF1015 family protein [Lachnospiraceae bacterium]|nr:DUF1015 family protein [Lachnospiraceae bacterium]
MADIRPFRAYRPRPDLAWQIASLPYDVYSREEAYELTRGDEHCFLRIDRPETQFEPGHDMYSDEVYECAKDMLRKQMADGEFVQDNEAYYYIYSQTFKGRTQTGIVAVSSVQDYVDGVIKKHENTRADKEADRIRHVDTCNAQTGPIFLAYRSLDTIEQIISRITQSKPVYDFVKADTRQQVWIVSAIDDVNGIRSSFEKMDSIYIADGHHRCASAVRVALNRRKDPEVPEDTEAEYFLSVLFPDSELMIMDYNRVIKDLNGLSKSEFIDRVGQIYEVSKTDGRFKPGQKGECGMYIDGSWYKLNYDMSKLTGDPVNDLDVAILQQNVLGPILDIKDPKTDKRIDFVGGIRGIEELERRCKEDCVCAFAMYPTDISELFAVADAHLLMPPKSTWFEPKLLSGLFIHDLM